MDVKNLSNWSNLSVVRNIYWTLSDYFISLRFLNQRLVVFNKRDDLKSLNLDKKFSSSFYDKRSKLFVKADEQYLYNTIMLKNDFLVRYQTWRDGLSIFLNKIPNNTSVFIVFIPHCSQLNEFYLNNMFAIGTEVLDKISFQDDTYPFYKKAIEDFKEHSNVTFLNVLPFFKKKDVFNHRLYYENDPHFSANGDSEFSSYLENIIFKN